MGVTNYLLIGMILQVHWVSEIESGPFQGFSRWIIYEKMIIFHCQFCIAKMCWSKPGGLLGSLWRDFRYPQLYSSLLSKHQLDNMRRSKLGIISPSFGGKKPSNWQNDRNHHNGYHNVWIVSWLFHVKSKQVPPKKNPSSQYPDPANLDFATLEVVIGWIYPPKDTSHHQDCMCLVRESQPKPSFAREILGPGAN